MAGAEITPPVTPIAAPASLPMQVEVAFSPGPRQIDRVRVTLPAGASAAQALAASGLVGRHAELARTDTGLPNVPNTDERANLARLAAELLEPLRAMAGCPLLIDSGFRSAAVNARVGGVPTSAHRDGRAADLRRAEGTCGELFERARRSGLPFDQLILEPTWIHIAIARDGQEPRRQALIAHREGGRMRYQVA